MTDGPQKSLPMNCRYKRAAERIDNPNYSQDEIVESLSDALLSAENRSFIKRAQELLLSDAQNTLFLGDSAVIQTGLEALEVHLQGSTFGRNLIDFCSARLASNCSAEEVLREAAAFALHSETTNHFRGMSEHWFREGSSRAPAFRKRCDDLLGSIDFHEMARDALSRHGGKNPIVRRGLDLDQGVPL